MYGVVSPTHENLDRAAALIRSGELVAFPTETVYGLGALALDANAVQKIFVAKGRPSTNPLIVHVSSFEMLDEIAASVPSMALTLAKQFWPGPLTLVLPKRDNIPSVVTAGGPTVAVRMPAHPIALELITRVGKPIAAPSANRSTEISPTLAQHVADSLGDRVSLILDGGPCARGIESTVVDTSDLSPRILRPGSITREQILNALALDDSLGERTAQPAHDGESVARSPGQQERHYAPRARVMLLTSERIDQLPQSDATLRRSYLLCSERSRGDGSVRTLPRNPDGYASGLYAMLHELDRISDEIVIELPPRDAAWEAIHDRLRRAAHPA
ncbi:MAG: L-threonylcarbamoyladenylate synthase [Polyangiaceae bacterium]